MDALNDAFGYAPYAVGLGLALLLVWFLVWIVRYVRATPMKRVSIRQAARIRRRWKRLALMAGLSVTDRMPTALASLANTDGKEPKPRVLAPSLKVVPDDFGVMAWANCLPKVGLAEFQKAAPYIADAWGMTRVSVLPDGPGKVMMRGVRVDPLITPTSHVPTGRPPKDTAVWNLGVDEYGMPVTVPLKDVPGVTVGGLPGFGKSSLMNRLICDWAPSSAVQFACLDGKVEHAFQGDYTDLASRMFAFAGHDLEKANKLLRRLVDLLRARSACMGKVLGKRNMWHVGPSADWPLVVVIIDEAHTYFRDHKGSDPETKKLAALAAQNARLVETLVKMGRAFGILTILTTQKTTGDAIPTFIRDVCPVGLSFAQKTADASVAALGDGIRDWPESDPTALQDPAYVGVAVMANQGRPGFVRIRTPYVEDEHAARAASASAHLVHDPFTLLETLTGRTIVDLAKSLPDAQAA